MRIVLADDAVLDIFRWDVRLRFDVMDRTERVPHRSAVAAIIVKSNAVPDRMLSLYWLCCFVERCN